ncbi:hypothetical protein CEF21_20090 [Bacillus sp. FJAT-42376]|uniref:hypothetical protein n=1 Tax=Bacillus sp. FJAT-42376 TaxID=2014076 RepID=UPI000F50495A|nr:hypothetical protein [Bacillus sp. FJAT-42376]AZB44407.1 hypothetical protein CEF21_20090 [Bacillus sp. FJAT-42376]
MSEQTNVIIINKKIKEIQLSSRKQIYSGFLVPINSDWTGAVFNLEELDVLAKSLSKKLDTYAFCYEYAEDFFWGFRLYKSGKMMSELTLTFEEIEVKDIQEGLETLQNIAYKQASYQKMMEILNGDPVGQEFFLADLFKEAFDFEKVDGICYTSLSEWGSTMLEEENIKIISSNQKKSSFYDHVLSLFKENLDELGFHLDPELSNDYMVYLNKYKENFKYTAFYDVCEKNTLRIGFRTPNSSEETGRELIKKKLHLIIEYKNKKELSHLLEREGYLFIKRMEEYLSNHQITIGNVDNLYKSRCDSFLKKKGYSRTKFSPDIVHGGEIQYESGDSIIVIEHMSGLAIIRAFIRYKGEVFELSTILDRWRKELKLNISPGGEESFSFTTESELLAQLDRLLMYLDWLLLKGMENIVEDPYLTPDTFKSIEHA